MSNIFNPFSYGIAHLAILLAAVALLASCGSGSEPAGDAVPASVEADPAAATDQPGAGDAGSPLGDLLGVPITDEAAMQDYVEQAQRDAENTIAECMRAEGFEYTPVDPSQSGNDITISADPQDRSFAQEHGFGLISDPSSGPPPEDYRDPNDEYLESLPPAEQEQFFISLEGGADEDSERGEPGGCVGRAYDEAFAFDRIFEDLGPEVGELIAAFESDPRIVDASAGWSGCMSDLGFGYSSKARAIQDVAQRYETLLNTDGIRAEPDGPAVVSVSDDAADISIGGIGELTLEGQERVDELAAEERAIAIASFDCDAPLREVERAVQIEYEQRFVDEHGDAIRATLEGGS